MQFALVLDAAQQRVPSRPRRSGGPPVADQGNPHHQTTQPSPSFAPVKSPRSPGLFVSIVIEKLAGLRWLAREVPARTTSGGLPERASCGLCAGLDAASSARLSSQPWPMSDSDDLGEELRDNLQ